MVVRSAWRPGRPFERLLSVNGEGPIWPFADLFGLVEEVSVEA